MLAALRSQCLISIHAPLTGSDLGGRLFRLGRISFQSTLPLRGATNSSGCQSLRFVFQSTLPLRGATFVISKS